MKEPLLYSFRRCPYAIRARLALLYSQMPYTKHEVALKNKPAHMLEISPKGTVPVLQLVDGRVIEESLEIALWALQQNDPKSLLGDKKKEDQLMQLIAHNDNEFKHWLDRYKYADRYPEQSAESYRRHGEDFLVHLENRLSENQYLMGNAPNLADIAIVPFVRQFAAVDKAWFTQSPYCRLQLWLRLWLESDEFTQVMAKDPKARQASRATNQCVTDQKVP